MDLNESFIILAHLESREMSLFFLCVLSLSYGGAIPSYFAYILCISLLLYACQVYLNNGSFHGDLNMLFFFPLIFLEFTACQWSWFENHVQLQHYFPLKHGSLFFHICHVCCTASNLWCHSTFFSSEDKAMPLFQSLGQELIAVSV